LISLFLGWPTDHGVCFVQYLGVWVFSAVSFVFKFYFYCIVVRQYAGCYFSFLLFVKSCFVTYNMIYFGESFMGCWEECILWVLQDGIQVSDKRTGAGKVSVICPNSSPGKF
jgi:hypothetical protein